MATYQSYQVADIKSGRGSRLHPSEFGGRLRVAYGRFIAPPTGVPVGDVIELVSLPKGARFLSYCINYSSLYPGTGGDVRADIGDHLHYARYTAAISLNLNTGAFAFPFIYVDTGARREPVYGQGYLYTADTMITARVQENSIVGNGVFQIVVFYSVD